MTADRRSRLAADLRGQLAGLADLDGDDRDNAATQILDWIDHTFVAHCWLCDATVDTDGTEIDGRHVCGACTEGGPT